MHISIIANGFQEDYIVNLLNNLKDKVDLIDFIGSTIHADRKIDDKIKFYNLRGKHYDNEPFLNKTARSIKYYYSLFSYLSRTDASIVHIQWIRFHIIEGILLTLYLRLIGKKVVYTAHDVLPHLKDNIYNRLKFKLIYRIQNQIIVHTCYIKERVITEFNISSSKINLVTHGVYQRVEENSVTKEIARKYFGLPQSSTVLLLFGIITEYKGFDILLESLNKLNPNYNFTVLVAGKVALEYKNEFTQLIEQSNSKNFVFVLRYIKDEEIQYCFKASDITVLPYKEASQSGVLLMSYAYGNPVIAPSLGGFTKDIIPGKTGYLFDPGNPESLANTLVKFQTEWPGTEDRRADIKDYAASNYSWDKSCNEIIEVYKKA